MSSLYVVSTPIGNLEDITLRALRVLAEVGLIAAEDTRTTRKLLARHRVNTPLTSYHEHNKKAKLSSLLKTLEEKDVALVSDAGTPAINDPGYELIREAAKAGFAIVPIPGPSALTSALAVSGLPTDQFIYLGFLPRRRVERKRLLETLSGERRTLVAFETPHRLKAALDDILDALGDRGVTVCREMTKLHEEIFRGVVLDARDHFEHPRGEFTLVIEGAVEDKRSPNVQEKEARGLIAGLKEEGIGAKQSVAQIVEKTGLSRRKAYRMWLETNGEGNQSASKE